MKDNKTHKSPRIARNIGTTKYQYSKITKLMLNGQATRFLTLFLCKNNKKIHKIYTKCFVRLIIWKKAAFCNMKIFCTFSLAHKKTHAAMIFFSSKSFFPDLCSNEFRKKKKSGQGRLLWLVTILLSDKQIHPPRLTVSPPSHSCHCGEAQQQPQVQNPPVCLHTGKGSDYLAWQNNQNIPSSPVKRSGRWGCCLSHITLPIGCAWLSVTARTWQHRSSSQTCQIAVFLLSETVPTESKVKIPRLFP